MATDKKKTPFGYMSQDMIMEHNSMVRKIAHEGRLRAEKEKSPIDEIISPEERERIFVKFFSL